MSVSRSRLLSSGVPEVWATLSNFGAISEWASDISHSTPLSSPPDGPGAVRRVQVGRETLREQVVGWDPPHLLSYTIEGLPAIVRRVITTWTLASEGQGTRVTVSSDVTTRPPLLAPVVARRLAAVAERLLADLSEHHRATPAQQ